MSYCRDFVVMVGYPASGKSTLVREVFRDRGAWSPVDLEAAYADRSPRERARRDMVILSSDHLIEVFAEEADKNYVTGFAEFSKCADKLFKKNLQFALHNWLDIVIDRTNLTEKGRYAILQAMSTANRRGVYRKTAVVMGTNEVLAFSRNSQRIYPNGSPKVPLTVMQNMIKSMQPVTSDEGFDLIVNDRCVGNVFNKDTLSYLRHPGNYPSISSVSE